MVVVIAENAAVLEEVEEDLMVVAVELVVEEVELLLLTEEAFDVVTLEDVLFVEIRELVGVVFVLVVMVADWFDVDAEEVLASGNCDDDDCVELVVADLVSL